MPININSNKLGGDATIRISATSNVEFTDLSVNYGGAQQGTVITTAAGNVTGTNTSFATSFANGDFFYVVSNSTVTDTRVINQVVNGTFMNTTTAFSAANTLGTTYGVSESIDSVSIIGLKWSTNGSIAIARGANPLITLLGNDNWNLQSDAMILKENSANNLAFTVTSTGTLLINVSKKSRQWSNTQWTL